MKVNYQVRLFIWQIVMVLVFTLIWGRIFNLQIITSNKTILEAKNQFFKRILTLRGDIRDRNGDLLVLDLITYDLYNNVRNLEKIKKDKISSLAKILNISEKDLTWKLSQKINTKILSALSEQKAEQIQKLSPSFVYLSPKVTRTYPHKKMAAHVIGFVNSDHLGQHGVEYFHENLLTKFPNKNNNQLPYQKGTSLVLTIDSLLQEFSEKELTSAITKSKASRGTVIVLAPKTGEIYAWAAYPNYDPNNFYKEKSIKNWSITDIYEPGSTFKVITVSCALESMTISKNSTFYDPGFLKVGKRIIKNHNKNSPRYISLLELFKQSSNVAAAQIGLSMSPESFYSSIKKLMIAQKTNIDLPGESDGLLLQHKKWRTIDLATTAFGQGAVSVTPLQLASAISAIANHGQWVQPHVLKGIWEEEYKTISKSPYNITSELVISSEVADLVSHLLKQSVKENLQSMVYIAGNVPGYDVAGKTGTAQKVKPGGKGYLAGHTVASFIGYLPADDPEILTLVVIDDPKTGGGWGNTVCGPVFNSVSKMAAKRILEMENT